MLKQVFSTTFLTHLFIALGLSLLLFKDLPSQSFYFLHDEFFVIGLEEANKLFFVQSLRDFGSVNVAGVVVTFFDQLYYFVGYHLGASLFLLQPILYFIKLFLLLSVPFIGFTKISQTIIGRTNPLIVFLVSLWFSFNTYTIIFWHGNSFSLTILIAYILCPLSYYFFHQSIFGEGKLSQRILFCVLFFIQSFALYLVAAYFVLLFVLSVVLFIKSDNKRTILYRLFILGLLYIPFLLPSFLVLGEMVTSKAVTVNSSGGETYTALQGKLLYPFLMWFSWGIYTEWYPRSIFTFNYFFWSIFYLVSPIIIYGLIVLKVIKKKNTLYILGLLISFLVLLFLIKGPQPPLGEVYLFLLEKFPPFRVFRSPDTKFAPIIIFALCLLLLHIGVGEKVNNHLQNGLLLGKKLVNKTIPLCSLLLLVVVVIQSYPLYSGVAIKGQNSKTSHDRIIRVTDDTRLLTNFLNSSDSYGYVLAIPPSDFADFDLGMGEKHSGQDLLPKLSKLPFVYISDYSGMTKQSYDLLLSSLQDGDSDKLKLFPIRYFLIRRDLPVDERFGNVLKTVKEQFKKVYSNDTFDVYTLQGSAEYVEGVKRFEIIRPLLYKVEVGEDNEIVLNQNFNNNWRLIPDDKTYIPIISDIAFLFTQNDYSIVQLAKGYANKWVINDNSEQKSFIIYFKAQSYFYLAILVSFSYLILLLTILLGRNVYVKAYKKQ